MPPLHFNGLANTQTQSEDRSDVLARHGSLKENAPDPDDDLPGLKFTPTSMPNQSQSCAAEENQSQDEWQYRSRANITRDNTVEDVVHNIFSTSKAANISQGLSQASFDSLPLPRFGPTAAMARAGTSFPSPQHEIPRPGSSESQGSIAGDLPYDMKTRLVVHNSRTFGNPLTESQESTDSRKDDQSQPSAYRGDDHKPHNAAQESQESAVSGVAESQPSAYRATAIEHNHAQSQAETEATQEYSQRMPSHGSQSKDYSVNNMELFYPSSRAQTQELASSQSQDTMAATQSTQPASTQGADDRAPSMGATTTTNPRSLLGMVGANKPWRVAKHRQSPSPVPPPVPLPVLDSPPLSPEIPLPAEMNDDSQGTTSDSEAMAFPETQPLDETQPSGDASYAPTGFLLGQRFPAPEPAPVATPPPLRPRRSSLQALPRMESSDMDVVPDSEGTQQAATAPSPSPEIPCPPSQPAPPLRSKTTTPRQRQPSMDEVIPDSYEADPEDSDEEDVPLAAIIGHLQDREVTPTAEEAVTRETTPVAGPSKNKGKVTSARKDSGKRLEETPLAISRDDETPLFKKPRAPSGSAKGKKRKVTPTNVNIIVTPARTRSLRSTTSSNRKNYYESSDEEALANRSPPASFSDELTDPDDNGMEVDDEVPVVPARKRKRVASGASKRGKSSSRSTKGISETPEARPAKRRKSGTPGLRISPTRVFALWKQINSFFSATVRATSSVAGRYVVDFDDGDSSEVDISMMRKCLLQSGDDVLFGKSGKQGIVLDVTHGVATVEVDNGEKTCHEISLKDLWIPSRSINTAWKDRMLTEEEIVPKEGPALPASSASKQLFYKTAFILTFAPKCDNLDALKTTLDSLITQQGGEVIEDWGLLFTLHGHPLAGGKKWRIKPEDVGLTSKGGEFKRVLLLSNETSHKPRFLIALALGVPCVNVQWLHDSINANKELEWHQYLLPAGTSEKLSARCTQLVDLDWGSSPHHLRDIMNNPVAAKPFTGMSILCLSPQFVPSEDDIAYQMIPRIVLCMGADRVEAAADVKPNDLSAFDLVVLKDDEGAKRRKLKGAKCVCINWVKECLITSRLLPLPFD
ncbi:hypothetical protein EIP86_010862 [Pleurotus ostreatoroseus]|nr:hypothetical protein EIP86_010862 [Pleurotus ostreatoroseus]